MSEHRPRLMQPTLVQDYHICRYHRDSAVTFHDPATENNHCGLWHAMDSIQQLQWREGSHCWLIAWNASTWDMLKRWYLTENHTSLDIAFLPKKQEAALYKRSTMASILEYCPNFLAFSTFHNVNFGGQCLENSHPLHPIVPLRYPWRDDSSDSHHDRTTPDTFQWKDWHSRLRSVYAANLMQIPNICHFSPWTIPWLWIPSLCTRDLSIIDKVLIFWHMHKVIALFWAVNAIPVFGTVSWLKASRNDQGLSWY